MKGINQPLNVTPSEMLRLNTATAPTPPASQNDGTQTVDPNHGIPYTDGSRAAGPDAAHSHVSGAISASDTYLANFPYLLTPIPGSPNDVNWVAK